MVDYLSEDGKILRCQGITLKRTQCMKRGKLKFKGIAYCRTCYVLASEFESFPLKKFYKRYNHLKKTHPNEGEEFKDYIQGLKDGRSG